MIDSMEFFQLLTRTWNEIDRQATEAGCKVGTVTIYLGPYFAGRQKVEITLGSLGTRMDKEVKVTGVDLQDLVDEYMRRCGFQRRQETALAQLAAPVVEQPPAGLAEELGDEIKF